MIEQLVGFFMSWFTSPDIRGIGLALAFGAIWLVGYWPPLFRKHWLWAVLASSAILSLTAVSFVQIPLQVWAGQALGHFWSGEVLQHWLLLAGIPQILLSGLVQEGAKLLPIVAWWWRKSKKIDPKMGLVIGAIAGAGLGIFEAVWVHNQIFAAGWSWSLVESQGITALAVFWERFFAVAFHIAVSAIAGYGLAKGWGWQFYLLASFLHALLNYSAALLQTGLFSIVHLEIYAAVVAILVTGVALWLRWRKSESVTD